MSLLFDEDRDAAMRRIWHQDADGRIVLQTEHDVQDIIDDAKTRYNLHDERAPWKGDTHKVAQIPMPILMELERKGITRDQKAFKAWLNDPDNRVFRTRPGKV
jgi:hypothetical protein